MWRFQTYKKKWRTWRWERIHWGTAPYIQYFSRWAEAESKEKHGVPICIWPYARDDYNLTLCLLQSPLQHMYHGQPYVRVDLNPMPESSLSPSQGLWIWPLVPVFFFLHFRLLGICQPNLELGRCSLHFLLGRCLEFVCDRYLFLLIAVFCSRVVNYFFLLLNTILCSC